MAESSYYTPLRGLVVQDYYGNLAHNATNDAVLTVRLALACGRFTQDQCEDFQFTMDGGVW